MAASPVPATGTGWSTAIPDIGQPHGNDYNEIQETKLAVSLRSNKEHVAYGADTAGGEHKPGSALSYFGDFSVSAAGDALPTRRPDAAAPWTSGGTALSAADYGRLAYDSDAVFGGILYQYTASGWVALGYVSILGDQTIAGVKTFSSSPIVPTLTTGDNTTKAASTAFVQQELIAKVPNYAGAESFTMGKFTIKSGKFTHNGTTTNIVFGAAFTGGIVSVVASPVDTITTRYENVSLASVSVSGFSVKWNMSQEVYWIAIGYEA